MGGRVDHRDFGRTLLSVANVEILAGASLSPGSPMAPALDAAGLHSCPAESGSGQRSCTEPQESATEHAHTLLLPELARPRAFKSSSHTPSRPGKSGLGIHSLAKC